MKKNPLILVTFAFCLGLSGCGAGSSDSAGSNLPGSNTTTTGDSNTNSSQPPTTGSDPVNTGSGTSGSGSTGSGSTGSGSTGSGSSGSDASGSGTSGSGTSGSGSTDPVANSSGDNTQASGYASLNGGTTGGKDGNVVYASTGTEIHQALCNRTSSDTPIIIKVEGTITPANTTKVSGDSCNTADGVIEIKEVSNVSIIGTGNGALFDEVGIHIRTASNIILQNLHVRDVKKSGSPVSNGGDTIGMESDVSNVWVDHCTLEQFGGEAEGYDSLFDLKANTKYVTLSYSILKNSGRGGLVGSSDSDDQNGPVTYHHNYYYNNDSRMPLLRHATAHSYNNYFNGINKSGMNPRIGGQIKAENNYFENAKDPIGTFYTNDMGLWDVSNNFFASTVSWSADGDKNHPAGPNPVSTTSIDIPYSYALDDVNCVQQIVLVTAGANTGLQTSNGACQVTVPPTDPGTTDPGTTDPDPTPIPQPDPAPTTPPGTNLSTDADAAADGSSKANGSSFGNVIDGDATTYWSPATTTGRVSVKWASAKTVATVVITEASGFEGNIGDWQLVNHDTGEILASGNGTGTITFTAVTLGKIDFEILSSSGTPTVAEFATFASPGSGTPIPNPVPDPAPEPTPEPTPTPTPSPTPDSVREACQQLVNDPSINWRDSSAFPNDQAIVECLATSLGKPVGFGEKTTGGYNPNGGSHLVVITKNGTSVEQQILDAISTDTYNWIVFDKQDFATESDISMHRLDCADSSVLAALGGASEAQCLNPAAWCAANGVAGNSCLDTFYNVKLNDKSLPIRNKMIMSNTTIDGRGSQAYFLFNGLAIGSDSSGSSTHVSDNVIITNMEFRGAGHVEDHQLDPDMIRSTGESHDIWIHQNTFDTTGDSAFDVKVGAYGITISFNKLIDVKRAALHGSSDSRPINAQITTTMHNNLFVTKDEYYSDTKFETLRRVPLMRFGQSHMFNNVFYNYRKDILSVRDGGRILFEDNMVLNNQDEAAANSNHDDIQYFIDTLLRDFRTGGLEVKGSSVWFADSSCALVGDPGSLDKSQGSTPDMFANYTQVSQDSITANRYVVGMDLAHYVFATAGKGGVTPYVSSYTPGHTEAINLAPSSCQ